MQRHTCLQYDISTHSQFCPTTHLGVFLNLHSSQQLFKTFSTLLKLSTPPTSILSLSACIFASYLMGKIEITEREITQLPVITLTDFHRKCIHSFLFVICLIQKVTLLQPKFSSLPQTLYSPTSLSTMDAHFLMVTPSNTFTVSSPSCLYQLAFKHVHTENKETKVKTTKVLLPSSYHLHFFFLAKLF